MPPSLITAVRAAATPLLLVALTVTVFVTGEMITAFRPAGDNLRVGGFYFVAIVLPWVFLFTERRKGVEERVASAPLMIGLFSVHMASEIMEHVSRDSQASSGFPWSTMASFALGAGVLIVHGFRSQTAPS